MDTIKVSAKSRSTAVAGAIAGVIREYRQAQVQAIGAGAVNQAIKAIAIARSYLQQDQLDLAVVPTFAEVDINGEERTAVRLYIESRSVDEAPDVPTSNGHHADVEALEAI
jgi:stage V sporulation protein S